MKSGIAIVGLACRYPDAKTPGELWENVLAQRRAFRRMPAERLNLGDYYSADLKAPDKTYSMEAALIEGYEFDRVRFKVVGSTYRSADLAHWLALDVAAQALEDAGFAEGDGLNRETTGVVLGNTLTGEFSRANTLRLRWPYVRRVVEASLGDRNWSDEERRDYLRELERSFKRPFPAVGEESLAGGLSNTIAGRICNQFDFKGGGFTVDGACAASLLAVINACSSLVDGDLDVALAGGVDLSLDPFELIGFAKTGALAPEMMRVYDQRSAGFWPGEGCGFVVLMREEDAIRRNRLIHAVIRGWGVSSDGSGGITRPEVEGQLLAIRRAYRRAGFGPEEIHYFEGHGTGTEVGDATELRALSRARREACPDAPPAAIGSVKANIGHTKAAAGVAGLIKATVALREAVVPPTTGCESPHLELCGDHAALRAPRSAEVWPECEIRRAASSAMGFGGINTHVVMESAASPARTSVFVGDRRFGGGLQDAELLVLRAESAEALSQKAESLSAAAVRWSRSELIDAAAALGASETVGDHRGAVVARNPIEAAERLGEFARRIRAGAAECLDPEVGIFFASRRKPPRIGLLFPGQGSPVHIDGGRWRDRFHEVAEVYRAASLPERFDGVSTDVAQPAIVAASLAGMAVLCRLGIEGAAAIGHSLGELSALAWAGVFDPAAVLRTARARGRAMADLGSPTGAMASLRASADEAELLVGDEAVLLAGINSPRQTVVSGEASAIQRVIDRAAARGIAAMRLPVSHAFHSPLVAAATEPLRAHLAAERIAAVRRPVFSTISGGRLDPDVDIISLLCRQVTSPVRFIEALQSACEELDLLIEVGPGDVLTGLARDIVRVPALSLDAGGPSLVGLLSAAGAAFALGTEVRAAALYEDRFTRRFDPMRSLKFFVNPCEEAPASTSSSDDAPGDLPEDIVSRASAAVGKEGDTPLGVMRELVARRTELPLAAIADESRLLSDLHLNSISVGQLVGEASKRLGLPPPLAMTEYADATVAGVAEALAERMESGGGIRHAERGRMPAGAGTWVRPFVVELVEHPLSRPQPVVEPGHWRVFAPDQCPQRGGLEELFSKAAGGAGVVLCLPGEPSERYVGMMMDAVRAVLGDREARKLVVVQSGGFGSALAKTLHLEEPGIDVCVVDVPIDHPEAARWVLDEAMAAEGYVEAHYDAQGVRRVPVLKPLMMSEASDAMPVGAEDVVVVTGGGKGIGAECALALARRTGAKLALLGRSDPSSDHELSANLERMKGGGVDVRYYRADVGDAGQVALAVKSARADLGEPTTVLHAAGTNVPKLLRSLDEDSIHRTLRPKLTGLRNVLSAVDPEKVRLLVSFGSIIARTGLHGEADYAIANECLARETDAWQRMHPACRSLAIEWSVWSGVGMGERLGRIEALADEGITAISVDEGVRQFNRLLSQPSTPSRVVVCGRYGEPRTLRPEDRPLPLLRFLEQPRVYYPGVELVVDAQISRQTDPYVEDHAFAGERLLPAVVGLEAMAQAFRALTGSVEAPVFEHVRLERPIVVPAEGAVTVRIAALLREDGRVDAVLRSSETGFLADHFAAVCQRRDVRDDESKIPARVDWGDANGAVALDPQRELYGGILFHEGRFRRIANYRRLTATQCIAELRPRGDGHWYGPYIPDEMLLGDPSMRDAAIHAIQACIPHATILPTGIDRLVSTSRLGEAPVLVCAVERARHGDDFTYDLEITELSGEVLERWEGLHLRAVRRHAPAPGWGEPLLAAYFERRAEDLISNGRIRLCFAANGEAGGSTRSADAAARLLGGEAGLLHRPDGKPETTMGRSISISHAGRWTLAVTRDGPIGCDIEPVQARSRSDWQNLLGPEKMALAELAVRESGESPDAAGTRVWAVLECLKKSGAPADAPLVLSRREPDGWIVFRSGEMTAATYCGPIGAPSQPMVIAVAGRSRGASL